MALQQLLLLLLLLRIQEALQRRRRKQMIALSRGSECNATHCSSSSNHSRTQVKHQQQHQQHQQQHGTEWWGANLVGICTETRKQRRRLLLRLVALMQ